MPLFVYKGRNLRGEAVRGHIEASSPDAVANQLFNSGITPVDIDLTHKAEDTLAAVKKWFASDKIRTIDLILFSRQMYTLQKAGVPIMQALRGLRDSTQNQALAGVIEDISNSLDTGLDLSSSLKRHPRVFSSLYISMIQVGETTGTMQETFQQMAKYLELEKETTDRVKSAMRYPVFVIVAMAIAVAVIMNFVIPAFAKVFTRLDSDLPWATQVLLSTSAFFVAYWPHMLGVLILSIFGFRYYIRTAEGRYNWDKFKLKIPVSGGILYRATLGRFTRSMAITVRAGLPLVQGMTVVSRAVDNEYIGERVAQMRDGVERGETIARTAMATGMFPPLVIQMINVGEESGSIDTLMNDVAEYYEREVDYDLKNLSDAIQPILIIGIGILVFILALGVFLPMWELPQAMLGG
jgi:MSHA biogenesis protein MshG